MRRARFSRTRSPEGIAGSLEPGKKADFIILDQDIIDLAENGDALKIGATRVLETWFNGARVYALDDPR